MAASNCPGCGAPIEFKHAGAVVTVCQFCRSVVGRGDIKLTDLGKVSPIVDSGSPLDLGVTRRWKDKKFELVGRAQLAHAAGGTWDEWYLSFNDGRWGWLAEAQGRFYLTFLVHGAKAPAQLPAVGERLNLSPDSPSFVVAEAGRAAMAAASGEIPYELEPGGTFEYADLSGPSRAFATLDYSDATPLVYSGREVTLDDLGIKGRSVIKGATVSAVHVKCPHCAGPLELRSESTLRAVCPNCSGLLDVGQDSQLTFLELVKHGKEPPSIPLGTKGKLFDVSYTIVGYVVRSVTYEGKRYPWREYLLYEPRTGFRWLAESDGHFSFGEPVNVADVERDAGSGARVRFHGLNFRLFQQGSARIDDVRGEFYWKVKVGDRANSIDYVRAPDMLSLEESGSDGTHEIQWTKLTYVVPKDIQRAFNVDKLPEQEGVAPNQPFPNRDLYASFWKLLAISFGVLVLLTFIQPNKTVYEQRFQFDPIASGEQTQTLFTPAFTTDGERNLEITLTSPVNNTWVYVEGDVINEATDEVRTFSLPLEYYHGVDGGESWSEGSQSNDTTMGPVPAGSYVLRLEVQREKTAEPVELNITLKSGVTSVGHFFLVVLLLGLMPMVVALRHLSFDKRRWATSDYSPYSSGDDD